MAGSPSSGWPLLALLAACFYSVALSSADIQDGSIFRHKREERASGITLTFVFDSTGSMSDELSQVKQAMQDIFDYMKANRADEISNFALVEFNDPYANLRTITTDANVYRNRLSNINVDGGGDCPEMAMTGIKIALEESLPNSYLFVFTDASAKDYGMQTEVENLVQRKKSKVVFVLTGKCNGEYEPGYLVYNRIAEVSNGQVFNLLKNEVSKVLEFVKVDTGRKGVVNSGNIPSNKKISIPTHVDESIKDLTVTVTGDNPNIKLTDPKGKTVPGKIILDLKSVQAKQVKDPKPGNWTVDVVAKSPGRFVIMAESSFNFIYGFSINPTDDMTETSPRPLIGRETSLLIQVTNQSNLINLISVNIKDTKENIVKMMTLHPVRGRSGTYTAEMFLPPTSVFLLEVLGTDSAHNTIKRVSDSGITPQTPAPPIITLEREMTATLKSPFTLVCHVESLVPFTSSWYKGRQRVMSAKQFSQSAKVIYNINYTEMSSGGIYTCNARNIAGEASSDVRLNVKVPPPLVKTANSIELTVNTSGEIPCQVVSDIDYIVTWTKKSTGSIQNISGSRFTTKPSGNLLISSVTKADEGEYQCTVNSLFGTGESSTIVKVIGPLQVVIESKKLKFRSQQDVLLRCTVDSEPITLTWKKDGNIIQDSDKRLQKNEKKQLLLKINYAQESDAGTYECEASNKISKVSGHIVLKYIEQPKVKIHTSPSPHLTGTKYVLQCFVTGSPKPTVLWNKDGKKITSGDSMQVLQNDTLIIPFLLLNHTGQYQCLAENEVGRADAKTIIDVVSTPQINSDRDEFQVNIYQNILIQCNVIGYPNPIITWKRKDGKNISKRFSNGSSCSKILTNAQPEDEGTYIVTAKNKYGIQKKEFNIHISGIEMPVLASGNTEEVTIAGKQKELTCMIQKGTPTPMLKWYKDGEVLESKDLSLLEGRISANGSLIFSFIKPDNEGTYICEAANIAGKARRTLNLKVHEAPVFIDDEHVVLKARLGTTIQLSCEVYGKPKPRITWIKDNKPVKISPSAHMSKIDSLLITSTTLKNNGTYGCVAVNSAGSKMKRIDLLVQDVPRIFRPSSTDIHIENGKHLELKCEVEAFPAADIKWFKNGLPFETDSVSYSVNNSSIRFTTNLSSSGEYTCLAANEAGHDKITINVTVTVAPFFESSEEYISASEGDTVTLSCYTDAVPPAYYLWSKIPETEYTLKDSIVTLENVDFSFAGLYRCDVSNIAGDAQKTFILSIHERPQIISDLPKIHFLSKGAYFNIPCHALGDPVPKIKWLKDGKPLLSLKEEGLLEIMTASEDDMGIYTCIAENDEGTEEKNMEIIVEAHPAMDEGYMKHVEVIEGKAALLSCPIINGIPLPKIQWLKNGVPVNTTRRLSPKDKNRSLNIRKTKKRDEGAYTCVASNSLGEARANVFLHVLIPPQFSNGTINVDINQLRGTNFLLDCSNSGKPIPKVSWFKNSHPLIPVLNSRAKISSSQVTIYNSTQDDQAHYKCVVENKAGVIERTFNVNLIVYAVEEGYIPVERNIGTWGPWSPWTPCTSSCGRSEKVRFRKCSSESDFCGGNSEEWGQCYVSDCKVDGDWSQWGNWSTCSLTCGSGVRFRERSCNNPTPNHGGKLCFGANRQHESCNTNPCPIDGSWSSWSAWQTCAGPCSNSTAKRIRKCSNPTPAFNGKPCSGMKVEYTSCVQEKCPVSGGWSEWNSWSSCSATCGHSTSLRERLCNNPKPKLNGAICTGQSRETRKCETELCDKIPLHASLEINGILNGHNISGTAAHVNITDTNDVRLIDARSKNNFGPKKSRVWYPYLSLVSSPVTWLSAFEKDKAVNGFTLTKGVFKQQTFVKFTTGEMVTIDHIGTGVGRDGELKLQVDIQGRTPVFTNGSPVKMGPYEEDYIQTGLGELFVSSSNTLEGGGLSIPYFWNKTIKYNEELGKLPSLVETLTVQNVRMRKLKQREEGSISAKPITECPKGFELSEAEFCKDINECSSRRLHNCHFTQTCVNYKGGYICTCPPGFRASAKGGRCTDVNECDENRYICSHKCINLEGSFRCLCPPGLALLSSKTNCSSILPAKFTDEGEEENDWKHCLPKQIEVNGMCQDEDPCEDNLHMCGVGETCVTMHGLYKCISVPCPPEYERLRNTKTCIKYCNTTVCDSGAKISEAVTTIIFTPGGPVAPYKDIVNLPLNIENRHMLYTSFQIVENEKGKPFRVKSLEEMGVIYSTTYLPLGQEYRVIVLALTYDNSNKNILYSNKFTVIIHSPED